MREAMFALLAGIASGKAPPKGTLVLLRDHWVAGIDAHKLRFSDGRVVVDLRNDAAEFRLVALMVAYRMVQHVLLQPTSVAHLPRTQRLMATHRQFESRTAALV